MTFQNIYGKYEGSILLRDLITNVRDTLCKYASNIKILRQKKSMVLYDLINHIRPALFDESTHLTTQNCVI